MTKRFIFMFAMLIACVILFLQPFTGMGVHAISALTLLIVSICHTRNYRKTWKKACHSKKITEVALWTALAIAMLSGFLLKPFHGVMIVIIIHKLSAVAFVVCLIFHIKMRFPIKKHK